SGADGPARRPLSRRGGRGEGEGGSRRHGGIFRQGPLARSRRGAADRAHGGRRSAPPPGRGEAGPPPRKSARQRAGARGDQPSRAEDHRVNPTNLSLRALSEKLGAGELSSE